MKVKHKIETSKLRNAAAVVAVMLGGFSQPLYAVDVDTELLLLVDVSGSVDSSEYDLMMQGYADAFDSASVLSAIQSGAQGAIAVSLVFWSGATQQQVGVDWMLIDDAASAAAFSDAIEASTRPFNGSTAIGSALQYGATAFGTETGQADNGFTSVSQIIDISGDGTDNNTPPDEVSRELNVQAGRDAALASGVDMINGLPIGDEDGVLKTYYEDNVIGGSAGGVDAFAQQTDTFGDVQTSLEAKLISEVGAGAVQSTAIPEPRVAALAGLGMLFILCKRRV
ncbi:DUF1194 domain-containing protein [Persicirhabdus sediminis]|uniref:DUF1194 domain-containing protein n=1 Tax=Persicirhabdus sediminis TaxID=454144 RepID=A0A8J7SKJ0_9BACT|nr:DUF1194 domain-containing protein [Persicirhabdus sediminis]